MKNIESNQIKLIVNVYFYFQRNSTPQFENIVKRALAKKRGKFCPEFREFAASLMFYSTAAYEYVRKVIPILPHPTTVRRWFAKFDLSPGICDPVLRSIQRKIQENGEKKGIEL